VHAEINPALFSFSVIPIVNALNYGDFLREKLRRGREMPAPIKLYLGPRYSKIVPCELGRREYVLYN
jgi:hypothetical protein